MQEKNIKLNIIIAPFYPDITEYLRTGACNYLNHMNGTKYKNTLIWDVTSVPGALEIPSLIAINEHHHSYHGYIALGCVIRGETSHYDIVAAESARGLMHISLRGIPVGNGILTCDTHAQALKRADPNHGNKGQHAAHAALSLINQKYKISTS